MEEKKHEYHCYNDNKEERAQKYPQSIKNQSISINNSINNIKIIIITINILFKVGYKHRDRGMSCIRSVCWGVPVREDTCPGPSAL